MNVEAKSWPKFDGTGSLDAFITKMEYFMRVTHMLDCEKTSRVIELLRGRAFIWLPHQPNWVNLEYDEIVVLL